MVHDALHELALSELDIVFVENVGNLVCPASFDLGQHVNVTLLSCTEGEDKPAKYPVMFRAADLVVVTKSDLLEVLGDFEPAKAEAHLRKLASQVPFHSLSARSGEHMDDWFEWIAGEIDRQAERRTDGQTRRPAVQADGARLHSHPAP
jgi:hydrogenase nickel incorporation protein HypB